MTAAASHEGSRKAALITGGARRIGRAIALQLAEDGWDIAVHYRSSRSEAEGLVRELRGRGVHAMAAHCELADAEAVDALIPACVQKLGALSLLVNNASLFEYDRAARFEAARFDRLAAINLRAPLQLARAFAAQVPEAVQGCIVNLLDQKVFNLNPDFFSYTVTKIALEGATRALAQALAPRVRVCGLAPGITLVSGEQSEESFRRAHSHAPLGRSSEIADIVQAVRYLASAPAVTGITLTVDGGQHLWPLKRDVQFEVN